MTLIMAVLFVAAGPESEDWRASLPSAVSIEEPQDPDSRKDREDRGPKYGLGLEFQGRWVMPLGSASHEVTNVNNPGGGVTLLYDHKLGWSDLFGSGWGTSLTAEITVVRAGKSDGAYGRSRNNFSAGGYFSVMQDHLLGHDSRDSSGNTLSPDDLTMGTYMVGGTLYQNIGNSFYAEGRLGVGAVHYSQVSGTFHYQPPTSVTFQGTLFDDTWNFAAEARGALGYRLGPVGLSLGMGFRLLGPPDSGKAAEFNSGNLMTWDIDLGVEIGF